MKYYAARLAGRFANPISALESVGYSRDAAQRIADNAALNQSKSVLANLGGGKGVLLMPDDKGDTQLWQALIGLTRDTPEEAMEDAMDLAALRNDGSTVGVFEWVPPPSRLSH